MSKIKIVPRKGSRKIKENIVVEEYGEKVTPYDKNRNTQSESTKPWDGDRWSGTWEDKIAWWDGQEGMFPIIDPEDLSRTKRLETNTDALNELVKRCGWRNDMLDHPQYKQLITSADIFNRNDPFFNHLDFEFTLNDGIIEFNDNKPKDLVFLLHYLTYPEAATGSADSHGYYPEAVRSIIVDEGADKRFKTELRKKKRQVSDILNSETMQGIEILKTALILGLHNDVTTNNYEHLNDVVYEYANSLETAFIANGANESTVGLTKMDYFLRIASEDNANVRDIGYIFICGINCGVIKFQQDAYRALGQMIGKDKDQSISYFTLPTNQEFYSRVKNSVVELSKGSNPNLKDIIETVGYDNKEFKKKKTLDSTKKKTSKSSTVIDDDIQ